MKEFILKYKISIIICGVFLLIVMGTTFGFILFLKKEPTPDAINPEVFLSENTSEKEEVSDNDIYYVDIKGAVKKPGVYEMNKDSRINDAIKLAGGFKSTAYTDNINLSRSIQNEMVIFIYTKTDYKKNLAKLNNEIKNSEDKTYPDCESSTYDIGNCLNNNQSTIIPSNKDTSFENNTSDKSTETKLININTASEQELTTITGIGESKARSIIAYREEKGKFTKIEDIQNVSGIGASIYEKIKNYITV